MKNLGILAILLTTIGIQVGCSSDRAAGMPPLISLPTPPTPPSVDVPPVLPCNKESEKKEPDGCLPSESGEANTTE